MPETAPSAFGPETTLRSSATTVFSTTASSKPLVLALVDELEHLIAKAYPFYQVKRVIDELRAEVEKLLPGSGPAAPPTSTTVPIFSPAATPTPTGEKIEEGTGRDSVRREGARGGPRLGPPGRNPPKSSIKE
jgi:hypothetical protein